MQEETESKEEIIKFSMNSMTPALLKTFKERKSYEAKENLLKIFKENEITTKNILKMGLLHIHRS